jgi:HlyD family secretion protein
MRKSFPRKAILASALVVAGVASLILLGSAGRRADDGGQVHVQAHDIVARGHIEPQGRVRAVHGPAEGGVVSELLVDQGQLVTKGQVLAVLDGYDIRTAELEMAERSLRLAEVIRQQTRAGAKHAELAAQRNVLAAKQAKQARVDREWERRQALFVHGFISQQALDALNSDRSEALNEAAQAANQLKALTETRDVDDQVAVAKAEVERAAVERAHAQLERLMVRAPVAGTVLSIQARPGELIGADGVLRLAALDKIQVVAEVSEDQAGELREGDVAVIEGQVLDKPATGKVTRIGKEVFRQKRPASDVLVGRDAKIVEVDVSPERPLPELLGAEVLVRIVRQGAARP